MLVRDTGHLRAVVAEYMRDVERGLKGQIADEARRNVGASFRYEFGRPYRMTHIVFSLGSTTVGGVFHGRSHKKGTALQVNGRLQFALRDVFTDPSDNREVLEWINLDNFTDYQGNIWPGKPYDIVDEWSGFLSGLIMEDRSKSEFKFDG